VRITRLAAGTLVLVLPLAAAAGCGAAKKRTIKQELSAAQQNLADSSAVSVTLRLGDAKGNLVKAARSDGSLTAAGAKDVIGGSVTYTYDAKSARKISGLDADASQEQLKTALADVHLAISVKDAAKTVGEIRLVDSTLFARIDVAEIDRVAEEGGSDGFAASFDDFIDSAPAQYQPALKDVKAGKWLKLPLSPYLDKLKDAVSSLPTPTASSKSEVTKTAGDVFAAVQPYIKVTDANDSSSDRKLDVTVDVRPAVKAALTVLQGSPGLPFGEALKGVTPADVDDNIAAGKARGTITLSNGHLKQVSVDLGSIMALDPKKSGPDLSGGSVVLDVDDSADAVSAPTDDVSSVDVKALIDDLLKGVTKSFTEGFSSSLSGDVSS
jgi:hypothetical protein